VACATSPGVFVRPINKSPSAIVDGIVSTAPRHFNGTLSPSNVCRAINNPPAKNEITSWIVSIFFFLCSG